MDETVRENLSELTVTQVPVEQISLYENNPRNNDKAIDPIALSIQKYGFKQPCVIDGENVLIVGHTRYKAALKLGLKTVPCVVAKDLTPDEVREYRILDNRLNEIAEWDYSKLSAELAEMPDFDYEAFSFSFEDIFGPGATKSGGGEEETIYNSSIKGPVYKPRGDCPEPTDLYKTTKFHLLKNAIEASSAPEEVKDFLRFAAYRHVVFDYQAIAEFYAHADKEVQLMMEDSALVIIDFGKAIEQGFVALSEEVAAGYLGNTRGQEESDD